jgi:hypothetical protein
MTRLANSFTLYTNGEKLMTAKAIKLSKPITAHGETLNELSLREPNGGDIAECGIPFEASGTGSGKIDTKSILAYISQLGAIPLSSARQMCPKDYLEAMATIMDFFDLTGVLETPSTPITS